MFSEQVIWIVVLVLSVAVAGAMFAFAVSRYSRQTEGSNEGSESEQKISTEQGFAIWLPIGVAIGVSIGALTGNMGTGIAVGVAIGIALGTTQGKLC
jgi:hypothetical protein